MARTRRYSAATFLYILFVSSLTAAEKPKTPAEEANYAKYSQHAEVARFLETVDRDSKDAVVRAIGRTLPAKDFAAAQLYLGILTREGIDRPEALNRTKPTVLIFAAQHGNEQSGKEAALALIRDLSFGELNPMLDRLNVLVIPQSNPYGNFTDRRVNEQNLDLNRDHAKLEAPETGAIHKVFRDWMPEVTLDVHLRMEYARDPKNLELPLKRFERGSGSEQKVVEEVVKDWRPVVESRLAVPRAPGYVVPASQAAVIKTLRDHGIRMAQLPRGMEVSAEIYRVKDLVPADEDYLPPVKIVVERRRARYPAKPGDYYVPGNQPAANLIPILLEPESEFGLIRYRAVGLVPAPGNDYAVVRTVKTLRLPDTP